MAKIFLGVVADDFTGASDAASMLSLAGVPTVLLNGIPQKMPEFSADIRAVVIATKTRTIAKEEAVKEMLEAFGWLHSMGAKTLYFKYCATFDSTEEGNIGPVADAVLEKYGFPYTILAPALPVNGRTVKEGKLYVNGIPLSESHMRNHPLTPMKESNVTKLMEMQSRHKAFSLSVNSMKNEDLTKTDIPYLSKIEGKYYLVPDYYEEKHGDLIADVFGDLPFLTGGSGLCGALGRRYMRKLDDEIIKSEEGFMGTDRSGRTKTLLLAGSCSKVTLEQIEDYQKKGNSSIFIDPVKLTNGTLKKEDIMQAINKSGNATLIYSSQKPEEMKKTQELGLEKVAAVIESTMSDIAETAVQQGYTNIISAGGETSGAVTKAIGYSAFYIGESVAPGVPVMIPVENTSLRIVLKSGGFGQTDFFERAVKITEGRI